MLRCFALGKNNFGHTFTNGAMEIEAGIILDMTRRFISYSRRQPGEVLVQ